MVGRGLRTICLIGEDHPELLQGGVEKCGKTSSKPGEGGSWMLATRATMDTNVSILILLLSSPGPLIDCREKSSLETTCCSLVMTWGLHGEIEERMTLRTREGRNGRRTTTTTTMITP